MRSTSLYFLSSGLSLTFMGCPRADPTIAAPGEPAPPAAEDAIAPTPMVEVRPTVEPDDDHDGRVGAADRCPDQAETYEGTADDDGCPDEPSLVRLSSDGAQIELLEPVQWKDAWRGALVLDQAVLRDLAALLWALPELRVEIQAHESPREDVYGMKPTDRQADEIVDWLVVQGIDPQRLTGVGYGETKPIADNATAAGRAANNRIEVWVLRDPGC
jgi:OOP family OmpA-OmpF porin